MPLCFGTSGFVRARQTPQCCLLRGRRPYLLPGQFPAAVGANGLHAQRRQIRAGAGLAEQLTPDDVTAQGGRHEPVHLLGRAVFEDRRRRPPTDDQVRTRHAAGCHLLIDQQLFGRRGADVRTAAASAAPAARVSASAAWRRSTGSAATARNRGGDLGRGTRSTELRSTSRSRRTAVPGQRHRPDAARATGRRAVGEIPYRATQIQMGVVLPGDADAAEHLDAVLGVGLAALDAGRPQATAAAMENCVVVAGATAARATSAAATDDLLRAQQHLGAHVLDRLEAADGLAELLAHLGVVIRRLQRPPRQPAASAARRRRQVLHAPARRVGNAVKGAPSRVTRASGREKSVAAKGFDGDAGMAAVHQQPAVGPRKQHDTAGHRTQHVLGDTGHQALGDGDVRVWANPAVRSPDIRASSRAGFRRPGEVSPARW